MNALEKIHNWNKHHALLILIAGGVSLLLENAIPLSIAAIISFHYFIWQHLFLLKKYKPFGGYANWVTYIRLMAIVGLGFLPVGSNPLLIFGVVAGAVSLDGVDGFLARKYKTVSEFGGWLDMESDAFYVCLISFLFYFKGLLPAWILFVGLMRYLSVWLELGLGIFGKQTPPNPFAKTIAGILFVALMLPWLFGKNIYFIPVLIASLLVLFSFSYSFYLALRK